MSADSDNHAPIGIRFSQRYMDRSQRYEDSARARRRVAAILDHTRDIPGLQLGTVIQRRLGIDPRYGGYGINWAGTFDGLQVQDFLDLITLVFQGLIAARAGAMYDRDAAGKFLDEVRTIFREENLGYEIDNGGGVQFKIDEEFAQNSDATLAGLSGARYGNARHQFEAAIQAIRGTPPNGKVAIRGVFDSVECVFKLMFPKLPRLAASEVRSLLGPLLQRYYENDARALRASQKALNEFAEWIDAAHNYRHEAGQEEPSQAPIELAVHLVSLGASHLRWLIVLDQVTQ